MLRSWFILRVCVVLRGCVVIRGCVVLNSCVVLRDFVVPRSWVVFFRGCVVIRACVLLWDSVVVLYLLYWGTYRPCRDHFHPADCDPSFPGYQGVYWGHSGIVFSRWASLHGPPPLYNGPCVWPIPERVKWSAITVTSNYSSVE